MSIVLLNPILASQKEQYPDCSEDEIFEIYCANNILVNYDLTDDQITEGIVDGSRDAGIDAAYVLINRALLTEDFVFESIKHKVDIELYIIQSKNQESFKEGPIDKLSASLPALLNPASNRKTLEKAFKKQVVAITQSFLEAIKKLARQFPNVYVHIFYCTKGDAPNSTIRAKATSLEQTLRKLHPNSAISFLGAAELYERSGQQRRLVKSLPTGTPLSGSNSYVALCKLTDYVKFIRDSNNKLMNRVFEANVRAYQGEVDVNNEIAASLATPTPGLDFWWLNNGVTIVADEAQFSNQTLTIENPLVVNGLQTSYELDAFASKLADADTRMILIRVIVEKNRAKRDKIIKATNRQTAIKPSSFHASEPVQEKIEDYLKAIGFFYDRRKNMYKAEGKPASKIISIDRMAQAVMAVLLKEPHTARARPTQAIKDDSTYSKLFSDDQSTHPLEMYGTIVAMLDAVNGYFKHAAKQVDQDIRNNTKFHCLMVLSWALNGHVTLPAKRIAQLDLKKMSPEQVKVVCNWVFREFEAAGGEDRIAKNDEFTKQLLDKWKPEKTTP